MPPSDVEPRFRPEHEISVIYSSDDQGLVESLVKRLRGLGWRVFLSHDSIPAGESIVGCLSKALETSEFVLFCMSPSSITEEGWALAECHAVFKDDRDHKQNRLIPVRLKPCKANIMIESLEVIDLCKGIDSGFSKLAEAIHPAKDEVQLTRPEVAPPKRQPTSTLIPSWIPYLLFLGVGFVIHVVSNDLPESSEVTARVEAEDFDAFPGKTEESTPAETKTPTREKGIPSEALVAQHPNKEWPRSVFETTPSKGAFSVGVSNDENLAETLEILRHSRDAAELRSATKRLQDSSYVGLYFPLRNFIQRWEHEALDPQALDNVLTSRHITTLDEESLGLILPDLESISSCKDSAYRRARWSAMILCPTSEGFGEDLIDLLRADLGLAPYQSQAMRVFADVYERGLSDPLSDQEKEELADLVVDHITTNSSCERRGIRLLLQLGARGVSALLEGQRLGPISATKILSTLGTATRHEFNQTRIGLLDETVLATLRGFARRFLPDATPSQLRDIYRILGALGNADTLNDLLQARGQVGGLQRLYLGVSACQIARSHGWGNEKELDLADDFRRFLDPAPLGPDQILALDLLRDLPEEMVRHASFLTILLDSRSKVTPRSSPDSPHDVPRALFCIDRIVLHLLIGMDAVEINRLVTDELMQNLSKNAAEHEAWSVRLIDSLLVRWIQSTRGTPDHPTDETRTGPPLLIPPAVRIRIEEAIPDLGTIPTAKDAFPSGLRDDQLLVLIELLYNLDLKSLKN